MTEQLDISYIEADEGAQRLDLFTPEAGRGNGVCVVLIHGGGFTAGGRASWHGVARHLVELGYTCAMPTYRFAPQWVYPSQVEDARSAVAFVAAHCDQWGCQPGRLVTMGSSAGGYLALILATIGPEEQLGRRKDQQNCDTRPIAAIGYCPVVRMYGTVAPCTESESPDLYRQADIAQRFSGGEPPILLLHGTADETIPIEESRRAAARLAELGGSAELIEMPGVTHGFGYGTTTPPQQEALKHVEAFLAKLPPA